MANTRITIDQIKLKVIEHFGVSGADLVSARRDRAIARPRQVAMYLAKQLTSRSYPEIARVFGGRDHTTVMHGVRKIEELIGSDPKLAGDVNTLMTLLQPKEPGDLPPEVNFATMSAG